MNNNSNSNGNGKTTKKENGSAHAIEDQEKHKALFHKLEVSIAIQNMYFFTIGTPLLTPFLDSSLIVNTI